MWGSSTVISIRQIPRTSTSCSQTPSVGGGGWHVAMVYCSRLQVVVPIGRSPFAALPLNPLPPSAVVPLTALCPASSSLAYLSPSLSLSFPLAGCANTAPGLSLFHCSVKLLCFRGSGGGQALPHAVAFLQELKKVQARRAQLRVGRSDKYPTVTIVGVRHRLERHPIRRGSSVPLNRWKTELF